MEICTESNADSEESSKTSNGIENGEIQEILELEGIAVWGQHQDVLEQQALSQLKSLTEVDKCSNLEEGEIGNDNEAATTATNKSNIRSSSLDLNKYLERQAQLNQSYVKKKQNSVSDKSKEFAEKISKLNAQKSDLKKSSDGNRWNGRNKKRRKDNEIANKSVGIDNKQEAHTGLPNESVIGDNYKRKRLSESSSSKREVTEINHNPETALNNGSGSEYYPSDGYDSADSEYTPTINEKSGTKRKKVSKEEHSQEKVKDDGLLSNYETRLAVYNQEVNGTKNEDYDIQDDLKIPEKLWDKLYSYQQDGVRWLWDIHKQTVGGLLGDEMGLGKTVQIIVFLAAIQHSKIKSYNGRYYGLGPSIIICPATVIHQWVKHFQIWWPPFRVVLLHQSSSYTGNKIQLINDINKNNGILVTTYESVLKYKGVLADKKWHYIILDEGHKIRNPSAKVTIAVKDFRTPHRLLLTGSPMQNNLQELWSLFDFIVPGKLGSQQAFTDYFATPITQGGYTNATPTQETTALLIATSLKTMITPFMIRRTKDEVRDCIYLPNKSEQILFCSLTDEQRDLYRGYLLSDHIGGILGRVRADRSSENHRRANVLMGITTLRKICNHPDLYLGELEEPNGPDPDRIISPEETFGYFKRSGKMVVVAALLKIWKRQGHRVLLFTQSRAMIDIFEEFLTQQEYKFLKMDGATTISNRQPLIDKFNQDSSYNVFLLTTRVGGLGVNLTGADRVIIYDPDWNPATDTQARERAWRIGQIRQVTVYRLVSAGTIEEKMYQRQVFKQLLSNKILIDPKTKRFFKSSDLNELFSLQEHSDTNPETANIFRNSKVEVNVDKKLKPSSTIDDSSISFSEDKIQAMKSLAQQIAKNMSTKMDEKSKKEEEDTKTDRPTPMELLTMNRKKLETKVEPIVNRIDDRETNVSFSDALMITERPNIPVDETNTSVKESETRKRKGSKKVKVKIDESGEIDGEKVDGLVKRETKRKEKVQKKADKSQDEYVLEKLFSKKGVHTALQHDVIVQSGYKDRNNLKVHYEAKKKADMALKALLQQNVPMQRPPCTDCEDDSIYYGSSMYGAAPVTTQPKTVKHITPSGVTISAKSMTVANNEQFMHTVKVDFTCEVKGMVEVGGVEKEVKGMISIINSDNKSQMVCAVNSNLKQQTEGEYLEPIDVTKNVKIIKRTGPLPQTAGRGIDEGYGSEKYGTRSSKEDLQENVYDDITAEEKETPQQDIPGSRNIDANDSNNSKTDIKNELEKILSRQILNSGDRNSSISINKCYNSNDTPVNNYDQFEKHDNETGNISLCSSWASDEFDNEPMYGNNDTIVRNRQSSSATMNKEEKTDAVSNKEQMEHSLTNSGSTILIPTKTADTVEEYSDENIYEEIVINASVKQRY
ncbi:Imitation SWI [Carabus blaptoides fortunei]